LNQFEDAFLNHAKKGKLNDYFENLITTLKETNHVGNASCYEKTKPCRTKRRPKRPIRSEKAVLTLRRLNGRHTMAMTLQDNQVPREIISQILGHNDLSTTNTYLDSFASR
jgi:integrase